MPVNKNAAFRYRIIDSCLRNNMRRFPSLEVLRSVVMEAMDLDYVSESTINKDIRSMKTIYHAPIEFNKERGGYYYSDTDFSISNTPLTQEEIRVLDLSTSILKQIRYSGYFSQFESVIDKLISGFRLSRIPGYEERNILEIEEPLVDTGVRWIEPVYESVLMKQVLCVHYRKFNSEEVKMHMLSAYVIREYRNRWYVTGYSDRAENIVTLALDRVVDLKVDEAANYRQTDFDAQAYFKYGFGVTVYSDAQPSQVEIWCDNSMKGYMQTKPLHASQEITAQENGFLLRMECYLTPELEMTILSYADKMKVLAPQELKERIISKIDAVHASYHSSNNQV